MNLKRVVVVLLTLLFVSTSAFAEAGEAKMTVRTFQFKYKEADKAAAIIKPLISSEGSMSIQPSSNSLIVTDHPENLKSVAAVLAEFDAPARPVKLIVRLVGATHVEGAGPAVPSELRDVAPTLARFRFNALESVGQAEVEGKEGEPGLIDMDGYRAEFKFGEYDPASDSIKLNDFRLLKEQKDQVIPLYKASLNLKVGQTIVVGTTKPQGQRALMLAFIVKR